MGMRWMVLVLAAAAGFFGRGGLFASPGLLLAALVVAFGVAFWAGLVIQQLRHAGERLSLAAALSWMIDRLHSGHRPALRKELP